MVIANNMDELLKLCLQHEKDIVCEGDLASATKLDFSGKDLGDKGAVSLAHALRSMRQLEWLSLASNRIGKDGASALGSVLVVLTEMKCLDIGHDPKIINQRNKIGTRGARALVTALEKMGSLQQLNLSYNDFESEGAMALAPAFEKMSSLQHLDLNGNKLGPEGALALAPALEKMGSLQHLGLRGNSFNAGGALALAPALGKLLLKHLDLGFNWFGAEGALALAPSLEKVGSLRYLDLQYNFFGPQGARSLAPALEKMGSLQHLYFSYNDLKAEGAVVLAPALEKMGSLQHLDLSFNDFNAGDAMALAPVLEKLDLLQHLKFNGNNMQDIELRFICCVYPRNMNSENAVSFLEFPCWKFSAIPAQVLKFFSLETLVVSKYQDVFSKVSKLVNCIESLPSDIGYLAALRRLEVVGGKITTLPSSFSNLKQLKYLDLRGNPLVGLPDGRGLLFENSSLNLSSRGMTDIPNWVWLLRWARTLSLSRNPLSPTTSFAELSRFQNLTSLDLSHLGLTSFSHFPFSSLTRLATFDVSHNSLSTIPPEMSDLPSLTSLNLSQNLISAVPLEFLTSLETLTLLPNEHLSSPPPSIAKQGMQGLRTYFEELQKGSQCLVHMKLLLLGDAEMGKTTLFEALTTGKGKSGWRPRTFGIDVRFWDIAHLRKASSGFFSVWDFAGQEDYVAAHSLFVGEAVVLLVVRLDAEPPFMRYLSRWLDSLSASVKSKTPFLVVGTHADRLWFSQKDAALRRLRAELLVHGYEVGGEPNGNLELLDVLALSSTKARGVPDLRDLLVDLASDRYCELYPSSYWDLHAAVRQASMHRPIVKWTQFWQQSQLLRSTSSAEETVLQMTKVLHEWGSVLFFEEMEEKYVVLNPQWLAKCVAKVVSSDEFVNAEGILHIRTWMEHGPRPAHFLLSLLQRFGIVCALNMESCLVPCRLKSSRPPEFRIRWPMEAPTGLESRRLFYRFERAAPRGFFSHLMARCLSRPEHYDSLFWDRGLVVRDGSSGSMTCVLSEPFQVVLKVRGHGDSVEELLRWLVSTTELLHKEVFPMTNASWISPCCCSNCGTKEVPSCTWPLMELERRAEDGEVSVPHGEEQMLLISLGVRAHWKPEVETSPVPVIAPSSLFQHLITDEWEWDGVKVNVIPLPSSDGLLEKVKALWERSEVGENVAVPSAVCLRPPCLVFPPWPEKEVTDQEIHFENGFVFPLSKFNADSE